jgi:YD repeat-containing protein
MSLARSLNVEQREQLIKDGSTAGYEHDGNGNRVKVFKNGALIETNEYDKRDLRIATTNSHGRTTRYKYDAKGDLTEASDGSTRTMYTRDERGQVTRKTVEDAAGEQANDRHSGANREDQTSAGRVSNSSLYNYDSTGKVVAAVDGKGQLIKFGYDLASYHPKELDFTGEGLKVGLTYKEFEQDEKKTHKPQVIKGDFGELRLSYTVQGQFRESDDDALMDVFAAALGAQSHAALVEMLSTKAKRYPRPMTV